MDMREWKEQGIEAARTEALPGKAIEGAKYSGGA
jgi:hypothetical protein